MHVTLTYNLVTDSEIGAQCNLMVKLTRKHVRSRRCLFKLVNIQAWKRATDRYNYLNSIRGVSYGPFGPKTVSK